MHITEKQLKMIMDLLQQQGKLENLTGVKSIQANRFFRDSVVGKMIDKNIDMNTNIHGWDGVLKDGTYFENKNIKAGVKSGVSMSLCLKDTSPLKLIELENGVLIANSFWKDGKVSWLMLGNTRNVSHFLTASYNPSSRKTSTVSMMNCLKNGFKIVAINDKKSEVWDTLASKFPRISNVLTIDDICTKKNLPALVEEMK